MTSKEIKSIICGISQEDLLICHKELIHFEESDGELVQDGLCRKYFDMIYPNHKEQQIPLYTIAYILYAEMARRWADTTSYMN